MKITVTLTQEKTGRSCDIQVSDTQKIEDTLTVLKENLTAFGGINRTAYVKEAESGRKIDVKATYEQAHIYSGAELLLP